MFVIVFSYLSVHIVLSNYQAKRHSNVMVSCVQVPSNRSTSAHLVSPYFSRQFGFEK